MSGTGNGVRIPITAHLDQGDIQAALAKLTTELNRLGQSVAAANRVKFNPVDKATIDDLKRVEMGFNRLMRVQGDLKRRMNATGQKDRGFFDLDWKQLYADPASRNRQARKAFEYVTGRGFDETPTGFVSPGARPGLPGSPGTSPHSAPMPRLPRVPPPPPTPSAITGGLLRRGLGGGLRAMGGAGVAADEGISAGAAGGFGAGLAGFAGGLLAFGAAKTIGGINNKISAAEQENIGYDTLKRQLGDVGVSFQYLKASIRNASDAFDGTFEEAQRLAGMFTTLGNVSGDQARNIGAFVGVTGGFARSFGMPPGEATSFFARSRGLNLTSSVDDTRRLAMTIGETIAKSGAFAKADEILSAAASFSAGQSRAGLTGTNFAAYGGALAGLVSAGIPGMDVTGAASMLSRVNSSIAGGGNAGEAGQAFLYNAIGRPLGLDPVEAQVLREQGMFGTGANTFGPGSVAAKFYGPGAKFGTAAGSSTTNIQAIMTRLRATYGNNPSMLAAAISKLTGLNMSQSMAFASTDPAQMGDLQNLLTKNGVDLGDVNATGISRLASIATGNHTTLLHEAASLQSATGRNSLSVDEAKELSGAVSGGDDSKLRDVLIRLAADRDQEQTEGGKTRASINDVNKTLQKMADRLVEPMNTMRNALVYLAGGGHMTASQINAKMHGIDDADADAQAAPGLAAAKAASYRAYQAYVVAKQRAAIASPEGKAAADRAVSDAQFAVGAADSDYQRQKNALAARHAAIAQRYAVPPSATAPISSNDLEKRMRAGLLQSDKILGWAPGTSAAQVDAESSFRQLGHNEAGAAGIVQMTDDTLKAVERRVGRKLDLNDPDDAVIAMRTYDQMGMEATGNEPDALRYYHGGPDRSGWGPKGEAYVKQINSRAGRYGNQVPDLPAGSGLGDGRIHLDGTFNLLGPTGMPMAAPLNITKRIGSPRPSGAAP